MGLVARIPSGGASGGSTVGGVSSATNAAAVNYAAATATDVVSLTFTESGPFPGGVLLLGELSLTATADGAGTADVWLEVDGSQVGQKMTHTETLATARVDSVVTVIASAGSLAVGAAHTCKLRVDSSVAGSVGAGKAQLTAVLLPGGT